jgi:hypothetical protein
VPVEAKVAVILRAMWPDFPRPETMTRPLTASRVSTAAEKSAPRPAARSVSAEASVFRTRWPTAISFAAGDSLTLLDVLIEKPFHSLAFY